MTNQSENAVLMWVVIKVPDKACVAKDLNMKELSFIQKYKQKNLQQWDMWRSSNLKLPRLHDDDHPLCYCWNC